MNKPTALFEFDNSFARELPGFYVKGDADKAPGPVLLRLNQSLAEELGLDPDALASEAGVEILAGVRVPEGAQPLAQAYAGHQFGGFSPQLGDGRALLLGEIIDRDGKRRDIQLKGSGPTPFSRRGDGKAAIGPVLREYIIGEAMYALGIPTTRALAAVATGEFVQREEVLPGAVLTRVAASHIRVGTFEFFSARGETDKVKKLADYAIERHFPELLEEGEPYLAFFKAVMEAQAKLIAAWMNIGFIHGVMNTDNMAISGETIDYGPVAFMEGYAANTVFSSIDRDGRYAFGNQPPIAQWNLARLAETLLPLLDTDQQKAVVIANESIGGFEKQFVAHWLDGARAKIGLTTAVDGDLELINDLFSAMTGENVDFTLFFRRLSQAILNNDEPAQALFDNPATLEPWLARWRARSEQERLMPPERAAMMNRTNPIYIPRNHKVEEALLAAQSGDLTKMERLLGILEHPFDEVAGLGEFAVPAPVGSGPYVTFCGT